MKGIAVAGNIVTDYVKRLNTFPKTGMLADILSVKQSVGGCVPNVLIDLALIDPSISLTALGRVGDDADGVFQKETMQSYGIRTDLVLETPGMRTSFSDAMCAADTGERTFFHHRGPNAVFAPEDIPLEKLDIDILHIGYQLILDSFDSPDPEYGTVMARFLKAVSEHGIMTSLDCVSDTKGRYAELVPPALRYCDYTIMNELEACSAMGLSARDENGAVNERNIRQTLSRFMDYGVRKCAVIHCPEAGYAMTPDGRFTCVPSLKLPDGFIRGSVGAGDAFAAGCLTMIERGASVYEMLEFASGCAAMNLSAEDSVSGMRSEKEIRHLMDNCGRQTNNA